MGFGIGELLEQFDLQVPFFVGGDVRDEDGFADHVDPDFGLGLVGSLWGGSHVRWVCSVDLSIWGTDVKDDLPRSLCDGMDDRLREG